MYATKDYFWNPSLWGTNKYFKNYVYMKSLTDDLVITYDEFIDNTETVSINSAY